MAINAQSPLTFRIIVLLYNLSILAFLCLVQLSDHSQRGIKNTFRVKHLAISRFMNYSSELLICEVEEVL